METKTEKRIPIILSSLDILSDEEFDLFEKLVIPYGNTHNIDFLFLNGIEVIRP